MSGKYFHTQESWSVRLSNPIPCNKDTAWLGEATYFWKDEFDAERWGHDSKTRTKYFEVYICDLDLEDMLDTVFNETHYNFWVEQIEKVAKKIMAKTHLKPTLKELNEYFKEIGSWNEVSAIQFQDLPTNNNHLMVQPIQYKHKRVIFSYRKRIQIAVYNPKIISNFAFLKREQCV